MGKKGIIAIIIIVVAIVAGSSVWYFRVHRPEALQNKELAAAQTLKTHQVVKSDKLDFAVIKAEKRANLGGNGVVELTPPAGKTYYTVNWAFINNTKQAIQIKTQPGIELESSNGQRVLPSMEAQTVFAQELKLDKKDKAVELKPQMPVENGDVFVVDKNEFAKGTWYLVFKYENKEYKLQANNK